MKSDKSVVPRSRHILIFEPRLGGHHLSWLRYVIEDLLAGGFVLTVVADLRPRAKDLVVEHLSDLLDSINLVSAYGEDGAYRSGSKTKTLVACLRECGADHVLFTNFDEVASNWLRLAAFGIYPPEILRGKLSGVYFRPRFFENSFWPLGNLIKMIGFRRLCRGKWFQNFYFLDEYLVSRAKSCQWARYGSSFHFLPDAWSGDFSKDKEIARKALGIPADKFVFLNYGIGTRRKGLHLVIKALRKGTMPKRAFLLCAGSIADDRELLEGTNDLVKKGIAKVLNRYVSDAEEELCFAACDVVLLPYVKHFGSSGVLSMSSAAGKMVIASDEGLLGRRVRSGDLGLLFRSKNSKSLIDVMHKALSLSNTDLIRYRESALRHADTCSREAFRSVFLKSFRNL